MRLAYRFLVLTFITIMFTASAEARPVPDSFADLVEKLSPAVVNVSTTQKIRGGSGLMLPFDSLPPGQMEQFRDFFEHFGGMPPQGEEEAPEQEVQSLGSGFVIAPEGYIVTNNHVIDDADEVTVRFQDDTKYKAAIVGRDPKTDLALLKIKADKPLPYVSFGNSDEARVGDWVIAIGNPYGLGGSVTTGIISARSRHINAGPFDDFLQTDAAINRGNSGGPMFNMNGEVIGINSAIFSPTGGNVGIGFAIPSSLVKPVIEQLKQFGRTHRGWLGVKIQPVTEEIAESLGLRRPQGALVLEVTKGSPAEKAAIVAGDVILSFDGKEIGEMRELPRIVAETKIGSTAQVVLWRGDQKRQVSVTLGELDEKEEQHASGAKQPDQNAPELKGEKLLGMNLAPLDDTLRSQFSLSQKTEGVAVIDVDRDGVAASRGIMPGDVIASAGQERVTTVAALKAAVEKARKADRSYVLLRVLRGKTASFVTLPTREGEKE